MEAKEKIKESLRKHKDVLEDGCILHGFRGSVAHGLYTGDDTDSTFDDIDTMAVHIPPIEHYLGFYNFGHRNNCTVEIDEPPLDTVVYELRKFVRLLMNSNPNVISLLWLEEHDYIKVSDLGMILLSFRNDFLSKRIYKSFGGYAHGQARKMTSGACQGYMGEKRKALVEKFGFDTKNASHLIRLLTMGIEILEGKGVLVKRTKDRQKLMDIKKGLWTLKEVQYEAGQLRRIFDDAYKHTELPDNPKVCATTLTTSLLTAYFGTKGLVLGQQREASS